ncbi:MAG: choice-of-anchor D domain-containing protein [Prevotella sp.]|nr:choice-of-anchor D domain-containing protein [Prevotella sp.]
MKTYFNLKKSKLLLLALAAITAGGVSPAWADDLTVYDGTNTNANIPFSGLYVDERLYHTEYIIPAADLSAIDTGSSITKLVLYTNAASYNFNGKFQVFLEETELTTLTAYSKTSSTPVYEGAFSTNASSQLEIELSNDYTYNGGNLLVSIYQTENGSYKSTNFYGKSADTYVTWTGYGTATGSGSYFAPKTTLTYETKVEGPALLVLNENTKIATGYSYSFGLATAGTTKSFTLKNPGTENLTVNVAATGGFEVSPASAMIEAGGEATLTVTMPAATASGEVTITPTATGIDAYTINVSGTVRDANKLYEYGFTSLPEEWSTTGTWYYSEANGAYTTVWYLSSNARLFTPMVDVAEGETFFVEAKGYSTSNQSYQHLQMQYSADGTTWTNFDSEPVLDPSNWQTFSFTGVPAGKYYIAINASQCDIRMFYGGQLPQEPKMVVTQPASLDFGAITETTTKTFTIANTGRATLNGITVTSSNADVFAISGAPTSLEAGASAEVTITMFATTTGALSSDITVSATDMDNVQFTVTGAVIPEGLFVVDFNDNALPENWGNNASNKWSFADGKAYCTYAAELTTPKLKVSDGDVLVISVTSYDDYDNNYLEITGSIDGNSWTAFDTKSYVSRSQIPYGSYATLVVTGIPTTVKYLKFKGYYVRIDEIAGLTYAPNLAVTKEGDAVTSPTSYDFGESTADATVTYNFANVGVGTLNITNVAITGAGAAAYSTNWTESVAVPFDLIITRTYDGNRTEAQDAVVTVTTDDGDIVVNVTGTDRGYNAPELAVDLTSIDFGRLTANDTKTVTVTNAGTGLMTVNIASDNALFVVSPAQLTDIAEGQSETFTVTFDYASVAGNYGAKTANITVTPTYDEAANVVISASAYAKDPELWSEDFADANVEDRGWTMDSGWSIADGKAVAGGSMSKYLTTPYLIVSNTNDELTFDYESTSSWGTYIYYYTKKDGGDWSTSYQTINVSSNGTYTLTGLEAGTYQFRFSGSNFKLDNFEGFKRYIPEHDAVITAQNIPTSGYQNQVYTATVTVKEAAGKDETGVVAKLYIGSDEMASDTQDLTAGGETTFTLTFTPTEAVSGTAKIVVAYEDVTLNSTTATVNIKAVVELAETEDNTNKLTDGFGQNIILKRTFIQGWNTICLPFAVSYPNSITSVFGTGVKAYAFSNYSAESGLSFTAVTGNELSSKTPYLLYIPETVDVDALAELFFESVSVSTADPAVTKGDVTFQGTYNPMAAGSLTGNYVVTKGENAKIAKAGANATLKGFRAYFTTTGEARMSIRFDDGTTTAIGALTADGELEFGSMYNLQGQKVQGTKKGLYIINGKKVVRK